MNVTQWLVFEDGIATQVVPLMTQQEAIDYAAKRLRSRRVVECQVYELAFTIRLPVQPVEITPVVREGAPRRETQG